jgi:hypothetical protein
MDQRLPVPLGDAARLIVEESGGASRLVDYSVAAVSVPGVASAAGQAAERPLADPTSTVAR